MIKEVAGVILVALVYILVCVSIITLLIFLINQIQLIIWNLTDINTLLSILL
jgi:hypothetical protein